MDYKAPWTFTQNSWDTTTVYDSERKTVCTLQLSEEDVTEDNQYEKEAEQEQLAKLIVKAPAMYEMLEELASDLQFPDEHRDEQVEIIQDLLSEINE